jgi:poly(A) polymerase
MENIIEEVEKVVQPVYLVGGSVRDTLLGRVPKDYDFATPVPPEQIEALVRAAGKRPYITGKRFGTIGFIINGQLVEVTTFRHETYKHGSRKPDVEYVADINQDLYRRTSRSTPSLGAVAD